MKLTAAILLCLNIMILGCSKTNTPDGKQNYAIGWQIGQNLRQQKLKYIEGSLTEGLRDGYENKAPRFSQDEMQDQMNRLQAENIARDQKTLDHGVALEKYLLAVNAKKPGVKTTKSGLQMEVLRSGSGAKLKNSDSVKVKFTLKALLDNGKFNVIEDGTKVIPVNGVARGWTEALLLTNEGGKARALLPASLAYGDARQENIPPHSVIEIEYEVLAVEKK